MAYTIENPVIGAQPIASASTVQKHPLGLIVRASDPTYGSGEFIYVKASAAIRIRDWCTYLMDTGVATPLAANAIASVGVAMVALATDEYGWLQITGKAIGGCKTAFADNGKVWITASAGRVDDTSVAGDLVNNALGASTTSSGTFIADFEINRPFVNDHSDSTD
jgi:hypothetical protein